MKTANHEHRTTSTKKDLHTEEEHESESNVCLSPPRGSKGGADVSDLSPVKSDQTHAQPVDITEHLVDWNVFRGDPADPGEVAERLKDIPREQIPNGRASESEEEEFFTAKTSAVTDTSICLCVKGIKESTGNKVGGPDCTLCQVAEKT